MTTVDVKARFDELAAAWEKHLEEERASSDPFRKLRHPAFDALVALGDEAVPLVMERYQSGSAFWGAALARITGIDAHGDGLTGNVKETRRRWLVWWRESSGRYELP